MNFINIKETQNPYVIAEIGNNHQGDLQKALEMIEVAAEQGHVSAVKFQKRDNKNLFTKEYYNRSYSNNSFGDSYGLHREFLEFEKEDYIKLLECAQQNNLDFIVTPFDRESVDFLEELDLEIYKIASSDISNTYLIDYIARLNKPIILSTGACTFPEIELAVNCIKKYHDMICLMHCVAEYPTRDENNNLNVIDTLKEKFSNLLIGYSGHDLGILGSLVAYSKGALVIEKHFTLDHNEKGTDHMMSLEPQQMKELVDNLEQIRVLSGTDIKKMNSYEIEARNKMGKSVYSSKNLKKGTKLRTTDFLVKSPGGYLCSSEIPNLIGKVLVENLNIEEPITYSILE